MAARKPIMDVEILSEIDGENLPELTPKDMIFLENLLAGESAAEAYRRSRPSNNMQENTVWVASSRLKHSRKMQLWLAAAKRAGAMRAACTVESHLIELDRLKQICIEQQQMGPAVRAEELRAKAAGLYIAKDPNQRTKENDLAIVEEAIDKFGPGTAMILARELGYDPSQIPALQKFVEKTIDVEPLA